MIKSERELEKDRRGEEERKREREKETANGTEVTSSGYWGASKCQWSLTQIPVTSMSEGLWNFPTSLSKTNVVVSHPPQLAFNRFSTPPAFNRFSKRKSCALFSHRPSIDVEHASATYFFLITDSGGERPVYTDWATASDAVWQRASDRDLSQANFHAACQRGLSVVQSQKSCLFRGILCSDGCRCLPWEVDLWLQVGLHSPS